jgi:hypothetical protein
MVGHTPQYAQSHVPPILPTNVEQRIGNLTETGHLDRLHQFLKHVSLRRLKHLVPV